VLDEAMGAAVCLRDFLSEAGRSPDVTFIPIHMDTQIVSRDPPGGRYLI
jgi:hypothetical protein